MAPSKDGPPAPISATTGGTALAILPHMLASTTPVDEISVQHRSRIAWLHPSGPTAPVARTDSDVLVPPALKRELEPQMRETRRLVEAVPAGSFTGFWHSETPMRFRSTLTCWHMGRVAPSSGPESLRPMLVASGLRENARMLSSDLAEQMWFSQSDFSRLGLVDIPEMLGLDVASTADLSYVLWPSSKLPEPDRDLRVAYCADDTPESVDDLVHLSLGIRGLVVTRAEGLEERDFELDAIDALYRRFGLRRYRRAWVAYSNRRRKAVGAVIAYRGPVGLDVDLLENRCELMVHPGLSETAATGVALRLMASASKEYASILPGVVPTLMEEPWGAAIASALGVGASRISHLTVLPAGISGWQALVRERAEWAA